MLGVGSLNMNAESQNPIGLEAPEVYYLLEPYYESTTIGSYIVLNDEIQEFSQRYNSYSDLAEFYGYQYIGVYIEYDWSLDNDQSWHYSPDWDYTYVEFGNEFGSPFYSDAISSDNVASSYVFSERPPGAAGDDPAGRTPGGCHRRRL